jgi:hypothetical protein
VIKPTKVVLKYREMDDDESAERQTKLRDLFQREVEF